MSLVLNLSILGCPEKSPRGKAPRKIPPPKKNSLPENYPLGKLLAGKMPPRKNTPRKNAPRKNASRKNIPRKNAPDKLFY